MATTTTVPFVDTTEAAGKRKAGTEGSGGWTSGMATKPEDLVDITQPSQSNIPLKRKRYTDTELKSYGTIGKLVELKSKWIADTKVFVENGDYVVKIGENTLTKDIVLGSGAYGIVYLFKDEENSCAVKIPIGKQTFSKTQVGSKDFMIKEDCEICYAKLFEGGITVLERGYKVEPGKYPDEFKAFVLNVVKCLIHHDLSYIDFKLANICQWKTPTKHLLSVEPNSVDLKHDVKFRLIDVDGVRSTEQSAKQDVKDNPSYGTFPLTPFKKQRPEDHILQTWYTALLTLHAYTAPKRKQGEQEKPKSNTSLNDLMYRKIGSNMGSSHPIFRFDSDYSAYLINARKYRDHIKDPKYHGNPEKIKKFVYDQISELSKKP